MIPVLKKTSRHKTYWGEESRYARTTTIDGDEWSDSRPGHFIPDRRSPCDQSHAPEQGWTLWRRETHQGFLQSNLISLLFSP